MKLAKLLNENLIIPEMQATAHWPAIVELVDQLVRAGQLPRHLRAESVESLRRREQQVSTGIGLGVAIPHTFSDHLDEVIAVFGRSRAGIDFEAVDHLPVHFIVLFIVPRANYPLHLRTLAAIAKMFTKKSTLDQLAAASDAGEILDILACKPHPAATSCC
jgi:mannitol/fructose-specific phosphotransferase system IIA component (Ntr-type)